MRLNVAGKILAGFLVVILLLGLVAFLSISGLGVVTGDYQELTERTDLMLVYAERLDAAEVDKARIAFAYLLTQSAQFAPQLEAAQKSGSDALEHLKSLAVNPDARAAVASAASADRAFDAIVQPLLSRKDLTPAQIQELATSTMPQARQQVSAATRELRSFLETHSQEMRQHAAAKSGQVRSFSITIAMVAAVAGILMALFTSRAIARPVMAVAAVSRRLADGDLTMPELTVTNRDEVGEMALAVNQMIRNLREVLRRIQAGTESVMASSEELSASSEESAQAARGAAQGVAQVANGAGDQSRATEEVNGTIEQLQLTIHQIAAGAGRTASEVQEATALFSQMVEALESVAGEAESTALGARNAAETAQSGADVVERTLGEMEQIRAAVVQSSGSIRNLEQLSARIGDITGAISGIAEQTDLLALNAAIEAARAGEHGRGFAVVADEVRKLAERAGSSTREITELIQEIQSRTAEAVQAMNAGTSRVEAGVRLAREAGGALCQILTAARRAAEAMGGIAQAATRVRQQAGAVGQAFDNVAAVTEENTAATEQMAAGALEVTRAMEGIARISQENAAASQEVSASVEELTASSEEVAASAQNLAKTAQELQEQVARFQI